MDKHDQVDRKDRRGLFAEVLLVAAPIQLKVMSNGEGLVIDFATMAELRTWLDAAGLSGTECYEHAGVRDDGRAYRLLHAYPSWHGWKIYAGATEFPGPAELAEETRAGLAGLVAA